MIKMYGVPISSPLLIVLQRHQSFVTNVRQVAPQAVDRKAPG